MAPTLASAVVKTLPDVSVGHSLLQMVIALAVIVVSIWGLGKGLARMRGGASPSKRRASGDGLAVVSRQSLGKDLSIATVRWGGREILVGIAGSTITFLNDPRNDGAARAAAPDAAAVGGAPDAADAVGTGAAASAAMFAAARSAVTRPDSTRAPVMSVAGAAPERPASLLDSLRNATLRR
ncbi:MAG TPA: flagellar biosynthetic protein FliO [Acidimicrobiales bacterium]|nr:flagellar biosynthetic protein FliO [Acidimicrobiales bacterium]